MRFTAEYDSEEEEFPVGHVTLRKKAPATSPAPTDSVVEAEGSSDDGSDVDDSLNTSWNFSPKVNSEAWLAMSNKDKEIHKLNTLHARSASQTFRNSVILDDLEATSITHFLQQLAFDDKSRAQASAQALHKRNADALDTISRAISVTRARAEEARLKVEGEKRRVEEERRRVEEEKKRAEGKKRRAEEAERQRRANEQLERRRKEEERVKQEEQAKKADEERRSAARKEAEERARQNEERARLAKEEKTRQAEEARNAAESPPASDTHAEFESHLNLIESIKANVLKACSENLEWRRACFELKRKITSRLGQLTNSRRQISRLVKDLLDTFEKGRSVHDNVLTWLLNFFSKEVVKQAENEVFVQIPAAFPLAYVCVFLMSKYKGLRPILLARFAKNCPWTVPFYEDPRTEEQMKRMGYKRMEDDKWEEQTKYIERQSGILATFAALTTHILNARAGTPSPYPLSFAWRWAARSLNHPAGGEIEAAMMATFLEVTNQALVKGYGRQAYKLVRVAVGGEWVASVGKGSARGRLEVMADEFSRTGRIGEEGFGTFVP